jgi:hypothetical protein
MEARRRFNKLWRGEIVIRKRVKPNRAKRVYQVRKFVVNAFGARINLSFITNADRGCLGSHYRRRTCNSLR